jgi:hypothetical protein
VDEESKPDADDERPPICPACGVTMGIVVDEDGATRYVCLECGFSDEMDVLSVSDARPRPSRAMGTFVLAACIRMPITSNRHSVSLDDTRHLAP